MAAGSDSPVIEFNVMEGIYCAVTRKDLSGYPEGGWLPHHGKYADLIVLDRDIFKIPEDEIKDVKVKMTV